MDLIDSYFRSHGRLVLNENCESHPLVLSPEIAALADGYADLLVPDEGCKYDQIIELNLDEVCLFENDPLVVSAFLVQCSKEWQNISRAEEVLVRKLQKRLI